MGCRSLVIFVCAANVAAGCSSGPTRQSASSNHEAAASLCPGLEQDDQTGGGMMPSLVGDVTTDLASLSSAVPSAVGDWERKEVSQWARGEAGHATPIVLAYFEREGGRMGVELGDLVHVCRCTPGMGEALRDRMVVEGGTHVKMANHPTALAASKTELTVWVNDRCSLRLWAAPERDLRAVAGAIDMAIVAKHCPSRAR